MILSNLIFCDASYHPQFKIGVGGFLFILDQDSRQSEITVPPSSAIQFIKIEDTNNIRMEVATVIAALARYQTEHATLKKSKTTLTLYSDCKNVCELSQRRQKLEAQQYQTKSHATPHANADLYRQFYAYCDELNPKFIWLKGHCPNRAQNQIQTIFGSIDKAVRRELRTHVKALSGQL